MGSIYKRGNSWRGQVTVNGKRKSVSGRTKKEVELKLAELQVKPVYERENITVQEWCEYWLETRKEPQLTDQSFIRLQAQFKNHIYPYIGHLQLDELTPFILEEMYAKVFQKKSNGKIDMVVSLINAMCLLQQDVFLNQMDFLVQTI